MSDQRLPPPPTDPAPRPRSYRQHRLRRLQIAVALSSVVLLGLAYGFALTSIHPTSVAGLLITLGVVLMLGILWRNTLRTIEALRQREIGERWAERVQQPLPPPPPRPSADPAPAPPEQKEP